MDKFIEAFFTALFWSSTDDQGNPLDDNYGVENLDPQTKQTLEQECKRFQEENATLMLGLNAEQCGHDFALTRNHHGAGFWDRGLGKVGEDLTEACHAYGTVDLYFGDDGNLYA